MTRFKSSSDGGIAPPQPVLTIHIEPHIIVQTNTLADMPFRHQDDLAGVTTEMLDYMEDRVEHCLCETLRHTHALQRRVGPASHQRTFQVAQPDVDFTKRFLEQGDQFDAVQFPATEGAAWPTFSPDGHWIAFAQAASSRKSTARPRRRQSCCATRKT